MKSLGILGGGQLSKLLSSRAKDLSIKVFVLSAKKEDPAAQNNPFWIKGDPNKQKDLNHFIRLVDVITFESEFFPAKQIQKSLQNLKNKKVYIAPSLKNLSLIQDRWTQKKLLTQYKIKTADFVKWSSKNSKELLNLWEELGPFVLKCRQGGYDGYGTFIVKRKSQIKNLKLPSQHFIAEQFIPFKRELALLSARNKKNQIVFFPLVESFQKDSRCLWVKGPSSHKKLGSLKKQIKNFLSGIDYQGVMAFELFDTGDDLIVNELAPRVHNSGHHSLDSLSEDQFSIHLKAIMNLPLKKPKVKAPFAMLNLLGEGYSKAFLKNKKSISPFKDSKSNKIKQKYYLKELSTFPLLLKKDISLWWYGKTISRKGRKMGHINTTAHSSKKALNKLLEIRDLIKV